MAVQVSGQLEGLEDSFQTFNQLSQSLETTYQFLEDRVAQLQFQLIELQQQRLTEQKQQSQSGSLVNVLKAMPAGVVVLDPAGRITECNPAAIELLGGPLREEKWRDVVARAFAPRADDGEDISLQDGRKVSISTCPLVDDPGQLLLLTDVTHTRQLQQHLNQHQRLTAMGEMAAGLAHQIRTPLSAALLSASQLRNSRLAPEARDQAVSKLTQHLRHLEGLVTDMLLFSRNGFVGNDPVSIAQLLHAIQHDLEQTLRDQQVSLSIEIPTDEFSVAGNQSLLQSALQNLINNAMQATGAGGQIRIEIDSQSATSIDLVISDDGPGIEKDLQQRVFEPFFTTRSKGTGLGLPVVRAIVRAHQGEVWIDEQVTNGTRFVGCLPRRVKRNS